MHRWIQVCSVSFKVIALVGKNQGKLNGEGRTKPGITKKSRILRRQNQKEGKGSRQRKRMWEKKPSWRAEIGSQGPDVMNEKIQGGEVDKGGEDPAGERSSLLTRRWTPPEGLSVRQTGVHTTPTHLTDCTSRHGSRTWLGDRPTSLTSNTEGIQMQLMNITDIQ